MRTLKRRSLRIVILLVIFAVICIAIPQSTVRLGDKAQAISFELSPILFDYVQWEINAIAAKVSHTLSGTAPFLSNDEQIEIVRSYMAQARQLQELEASIAAVYTNPAVTDPETETAPLQTQRDAIRHDLEQKQSLVESILEGQISSVLVDQGFGWMGQILPPISMRFFRVPNSIVVSPRDEIRLELAYNLEALTIDEIANLEEEIDEEHNVSSLIVPIGGIALYPAMILENASIPWTIETFAHEWLHHYLFAFPLGISYFTGTDGLASEARIINETTADIFGKEIARLVLDRYYPDLLPPEPVPDSRITEVPNSAVETEPQQFDFGATMHETRTQVDELLAAGQIEDAEAYMEEQRQIFIQNGFPIRKLNQAYFAFYGGYQSDSSPGIGGDDPIGPAVGAILDSSDSIHDFVIRMRNVTTREQLLSESNQ